MLENSRAIRSAYICTLTLLVMATLNLFVESLALHEEFNAKDSRVVSLKFCEENNITRENSFYEHYSPFAPGGKSPHGAYNERAFKVAGKDRKLRYIVLSSHMYSRFFAEPERFAYIVASHKKLESQTLVKQFDAANYTPSKRANRSPIAIINLLKNGPRSIQFILGLKPLYAGPTIKIYKTNDVSG